MGIPKRLPVLMNWLILLLYASNALKGSGSIPDGQTVSKLPWPFYHTADWTLDYLRQAASRVPEVVRYTEEVDSESGATLPMVTVSDFSVGWPNPFSASLRQFPSHLCLFPSVPHRCPSLALIVISSLHSRFFGLPFAISSFSVYFPSTPGTYHRLARCAERAILQTMRLAIQCLKRQENRLTRYLPHLLEAVANDCLSIRCISHEAISPPPFIVFEDNKGKRVVVLVFGEHAREIITTEVALWLTRLLIGDADDLLAVSSYPVAAASRCILSISRLSHLLRGDAVVSYSSHAEGECKAWPWGVRPHGVLDPSPPSQHGL